MRLSELTQIHEVAHYVNRLLLEFRQSEGRIRFDAQLNQSLWNYVGRQNESSPLTTILDDVSGRIDVYPAIIEPIRRININRIQNVVMSMLANQASDPPKVTFVAREQGEPPLVYLNTDAPEAMALLQRMAIDPMQPIPDPIVAMIRQEIEAADVIRQNAMATGQPVPPGLLTPDVLVDVDDDAAAEMRQTIFDGLWEACNGQFHFVENILNKCIFGWQPTLYEWDAAVGYPRLRNVNVRHCFVDTLHTDPLQGTEAIWDEIISADEAAARYPEFAEVIYENSSMKPVYPEGRNYTISAQYDQTFFRDMCIVRHAWIANQPYPMTPDEALSSGQVSVQQVPTGEVQPITDDMGSVVGEQPVTQSAMVLPDGTEVNEKHEKWPKKFGIRYICVVGRNVVKDEQSPYDLIPLAENVNTPMPNTRYGQGEPERLSPMQEALDRVISAIVSHFEYNAFPVEITTEDVNDKLESTMSDARVQPGKRVVVPTDLISQFFNGGQLDLTKLFAYLETSNMSPDAWNLLKFLMDSIDKEGHQAEVLQGNAAPGWSGEAINSLQNAATQVIRVKSQRSEFYLKYLVRLFDQDISRMSPDEARRWCSKYPPQVFLAIHSRQKSMIFDTGIEIRSGSGAAKKNRVQELIAARSAGVMVDQDTILEHMELDPEVVKQRNATDMAQQNALAMVQSPGNNGDVKQVTAQES